MKIDKFDGSYAFLSNFYPAEVTWNNLKFPCVENAYQAAKCVNPSDQIPFQTMKPGQAKRTGRTVLCRPDWDDVKLSIMNNLISQKFTLHPQLKSQLLNTGDMELIEGNYWHDAFWGVCNGQGENHLGQILMRVRKNLSERSKQGVLELSLQSTTSLLDLPRNTQDLLCVTTNLCVKRNGSAVMGAGVAKLFRDALPGIDFTLGRMIQNGHIGTTFLGTFPYRENMISVAAFPTKNDWRQPSSKDLIRKSTKELLALTTIMDFHKIYLPRPGCQNGGLSWYEVKPILNEILDHRFVITHL